MKAIVLPEYNNNLIRGLISLKVENRIAPDPKAGEVQIKIEAAPCNPSDIAFMRGAYNIKKTLPCIPGFEGAGIITAVGEGVEQELIGQKVSCFVRGDGQGTWSEVVSIKIEDCILLKEEMPIDQAACFAVNPFTAYGMYQMVCSNFSKAFIQNAAASQLGKFMRELAKMESVKVINIVRKPEQVEQLKTEGAEFVLNCTDTDFECKLKELASELNATIAFDAVAGEATGQLLNAMAAESKVVVYGGLSGMPISGIETMGVIFHKKTIRGFTLTEWIEGLEEGEFEDISEYLQDLFIEGKLKTDIQTTCAYEEVVKGIRAYIGNMSGGKVLIKAE